MTMIDFTPLFRSAVGFDHLASMLEEASRSENNGYPPYNIEISGEDRYRITMAVAGFSESDLELEVKENLLRVAGKKDDDGENRKFLHRGIANRAFERRFQLADHVRVEGAHIKDGLLHVDLVREIPEAMKPRKIEIGRAEPKPAIEGRAEAA
jgi:molecular chaperone IbpA